MNNFADLEERIRNKLLASRLMNSEEAFNYIKPNMVIGCSGFTSVGYPKSIPLYAVQKAQSSAPFPLTIWCGASSGKEIDEQLAVSGYIIRRYPYQSNKVMRQLINEGKIEFQDIHLSLSGQNFRYGFYGEMDIALIEATAITEEGGIVPTTAVGDAATYAQCAKKIIIEINTNQPKELEGIHDIFIPENPPYRTPIPITSVSDRIGEPFIRCDIDKILGIVPSSTPDCGVLYKKDRDGVSEKIAQNVLDFLDIESHKNIINLRQLPLQFGVGRVANIVLAELAKLEHTNIKIYSEVLQDPVLSLIDTDKLDFASGTSLTMSSDGFKKLFANIAEYTKKIILRPEEISNNPEVIRRLGVIAINTALEVDIWGNVNSSHSGHQIVNGIGGSGDFARNAYLTIFVCPSMYKKDGSSNIVSHCEHVDHTEHDVDIIVTEYGVADLRGLSHIARANEIISKCAHPSYREDLYAYLHSTTN